MKTTNETSIVVTLGLKGFINQQAVNLSGLLQAPTPWIVLNRSKPEKSVAKDHIIIMIMKSPGQLHLGLPTH